MASGAALPGVTSIEGRVPTYVLLLDAPMRDIDPGNRFLQALERGYTIEASFQGVPLYRRR